MRLCADEVRGEALPYFADRLIENVNFSRETSTNTATASAAFCFCRRASTPATGTCPTPYEDKLEHYFG